MITEASEARAVVQHRSQRRQIRVYEFICPSYDGLVRDFFDRRLKNIHFSKSRAVFFKITAAFTKTNIGSFAYHIRVQASIQGAEYKARVLGQTIITVLPFGHKEHQQIDIDMPLVRWLNHDTEVLTPGL